MTVTEKEEPKKSGLPDGAQPATIDQLPEEEKFQLMSEEELKAKKERDSLLYGDFREDRAEAVAVTKAKEEKAETLNFMKGISEQAGKDLAYYAGLDKYDLEMDDGHTERYYRVSPTDYEWDELEDLRAEVEGGEAMDDGHKLTKRETRQKTKLLEQLKAKYYLRNTKTQNPMMPADKAHVKNASKLGAILDACVVVSLHKAVQGKK
jgi:hypothetical protein